MPLSIMTLSIMTLSIMTLGLMTLSIMKLNIMTLNIMTLTINDTQHKNTLYQVPFCRVLLYCLSHFIYCHADCQSLPVVMLNVVMLSVVASLKKRVKAENDFFSN